MGTGFGSSFDVEEKGGRGESCYSSGWEGIFMVVIIDIGISSRN